MQSYMGSLIRPEGWLEWQGDFALSTLYYAEYMNFGRGAWLSRRVKWTGYHPVTDPMEAKNYTVGQFIDDNLWLPGTCNICKVHFGSGSMKDVELCIFFCGLQAALAFGCVWQYDTCLRYLMSSE